MSVSDFAPELIDALYAAGIPGAAVLTVKTINGTGLESVVVNTPHECAAWVDSYEASERADSSILASDRKVFCVASSLAITPAPGNTIAVAGATFSVITVQCDPAGACWLLQART